jgi:hypothetical protein
MAQADLHDMDKDKELFFNFNPDGPLSNFRRNRERVTVRSVRVKNHIFDLYQIDNTGYTPPDADRKKPEGVKNPDPQQRSFAIFFAFYILSDNEENISTPDRYLLRYNVLINEFDKWLSSSQQAQGWISRLVTLPADDFNETDIKQKIFIYRHGPTKFSAATLDLTSNDKILEMNEKINAFYLKYPISTHTTVRSIVQSITKYGFIDPLLFIPLSSNTIYNQSLDVSKAFDFALYHAYISNHTNEIQKIILANKQFILPIPFLDNPILIDRIRTQIIDYHKKLGSGSFDSENELSQLQADKVINFGSKEINELINQLNYMVQKKHDDFFFKDTTLFPYLFLSEYPPTKPEHVSKIINKKVSIQGFSFSMLLMSDYACVNKDYVNSSLSSANITDDIRVERIIEIVTRNNPKQNANCDTPNTSNDSSKIKKDIVQLLREKNFIKLLKQDDRVIQNFKTITTNNIVYTDDLNGLQQLVILSCFQVPYFIFASKLCMIYYKHLHTTENYFSQSALTTYISQRMNLMRYNDPTKILKPNLLFGDLLKKFEFIENYNEKRAIQRKEMEKLIKKKNMLMTTQQTTKTFKVLAGIYNEMIKTRNQNKKSIIPFLSKTLESVKPVKEAFNEVLARLPVDLESKSNISRYLMKLDYSYTNNYLKKNNVYLKFPTLPKPEQNIIYVDLKKTKFYVIYKYFFNLSKSKTNELQNQTTKKWEFVLKPITNTDLTAIKVFEKEMEPEHNYFTKRLKQMTAGSRTRRV